MEEEVGGILPYLDVKVIRKDGIIHTTVYRKPTKSLSTLHDTSNHPRQHRNACIFFLYDRARDYCCEPHLYIDEIKEVRNILTNSGFSDSRVQRAIASRALRHIKNKHQSNTSLLPSPPLPPHPSLLPPPPTSNQHVVVNDMEYGHKITVVLPYCDRELENGASRLRKLGLNVIFKPRRNLASILARPKIRLYQQCPPLEEQGVVYGIKCRDCNKSYVGQTGRSLGTRIKEHAGYLKRQESNKSPIVEHFWDQGHGMDPYDACILYKATDIKKRSNLERYSIYTLNDLSMNRKDEGFVNPHFQNNILSICENTIKSKLHSNSL